MSINDSISDYNSDENVYNKYISELEELSKSKDITQEKCARIFESCRIQLKEAAPLITSGAPSTEGVDKVLSVMKEQLHYKTCELAKQLVESKLNLLDPEVYKSFSYPLRLEIAKGCAAKEDSPLLQM